MILAAGIGLFEDRLRAAVTASDAVAAELVAEEEQSKKKKADKEAKKKRKKKASSRKQVNLPAPSAAVTVESLGYIVRKLEAENSRLVHANKDNADRVQSLEQTAKSLEQKLALVGAHHAFFPFHFACTRSD
jgi:hypothetical protein